MKVKIISNVIPAKLEQEVNEWIAKDPTLPNRITDIKYVASGSGCYSVMIIYNAFSKYE